MEDRRLALPWFRPGDYDEIRRIMSDGPSMAMSYEAWLRSAEANSEKAASHGIRTERVMIEPYEFEVWCAAYGIEKDEYARDLFATENATFDINVNG